MKYGALFLILLCGIAWGQKTEYVSSPLNAPGWIAGICSEAPKCPSTARLEWRSHKQCIYRCVQRVLPRCSTYDARFECQQFRAMYFIQFAPLLRRTPVRLEPLNYSVLPCGDTCKNVLVWDDPYWSKTVYPIQPFPAEESMDVPAIKDDREEEYGDADWCNACKNGWCTAMACNPHAKHTVTYDTCADKSRILLTDESGGKHCVKFPK